MGGGFGGNPRERIRRDWKSIREEVARQYGASGKSDDELFVAVSMHNQVRLSQRETLFELYQEEYDRTLAGSGTAPDERRKEAVSAWPEEMQAVADQLKSRAVSDALDDRNRLADAAGIIRRGLENRGVKAAWAPTDQSMKAREMDLRHGFREERSGGGGPPSNTPCASHSFKKSSHGAERHLTAHSASFARRAAFSASSSSPGLALTNTAPFQRGGWARTACMASLPPRE